MKKITFAFTLILAMNVQAFAVDISTTLSIPQVDGLGTPQNLTSEITSSNDDARYRFSLSSAGAKNLLRVNNLPPMNSVVESVTHNIIHHRDVTPQCQVAHQSQDETFLVNLTDIDWVKKKGFLCRVERFFSKNFCLPNSQDIITHGQFEHVGDAPSGNPIIQPIQDTACVSSAPNGDAQLMDQLNTCTDNHALTADCLAALSSMPASETHSVWTVSRSLHGERDLRQILPPLVKEYDEDQVTNHRTTKTLVMLQLGALKLNAVATGAIRYECEYLLQQLTTALATTDQNLDLTAVYNVMTDGLDLPAVSETRTGVLPTSEFKMNNFPAVVSLSKKDIISFEQIVDSDTYRSLATSLISSCQQFSSHLSEFGTFMCRTHEGDLLGTFIRRVEYRVRVRDQDGVERFLTWIREAPASSCNVNPDGSFSCSVPQDYSRFFEDTSVQLGGFFDDPSYEDAVVKFSIKSFLPKARPGAPALQDFIREQSNQFEFVHTLR